MKTTTKWKYMGKMILEEAHSKNYKPKNIVKHWISDGEYYWTCDAYKKVSVKTINYKTVKTRGIISIAFGGKYGGQTAPVNKYSLYLYTKYQYPDSFCKPRIHGSKVSDEITKLNRAKTRY